MAARWAKQRDKNEPPIVAALRRIGAVVLINDHPDLIVGFRGRTFLLEIKTKTGRLRKSQTELFSTWNGGALGICRTIEDAIAFVTLKGG